MEKPTERKRKSKGSLSVLDEFTGEAGSISFAPNLSEDVKARIDEKTKLADVPSSVRLDSPIVVERSSKSEENKAAAASLLADLEKECPIEVAELLRSQIGARTQPKVGTKWEQTGNKVGAKLSKIQEQSGSKLGTKWEHGFSRSDLSGNKVGTQPGTQVGTKWEQTGNKVGANRDVSTLVGLQRRILVCFYESCLRARAHHTERLPIEKIAQTSGTSVQSAKVTIRRLEKATLVKRLEYKDGRGGWTIYELPNHVHSYLRLDETGNKVGTNWEQSRSKVGAQPGTQPGTTPSSSSRNFLIKEESTTTQIQAATSQIDLGLVQPFGITASVLSRCVELYPSLKPEQLEVLVFRFAEFAKDPKNRVQNARGFFISLAEQASKGQIPLDHIETPDERLMRLFVSRQEEAKTRRLDFEQKALEFECEAWLETLTTEMKLSLIPESSILKAGTAAHAAMLKRHFAEKLWPARRTEILASELSP